VSIGWFGAVAAFLAISVTGLTSADREVVRAGYLVADLITWRVIVPFALAALLTGLIQSLGTTWGLFRHYWIVAKLLLTVIATLLLLLHTGPIDRVAAAASQGPLAASELRPVRVQLLADAIGASIALLVATTLSVYRPRGLTPYGLRRQYADAGAAFDPHRRTARPVARYALLGIVALLLLALLSHLLGGGLHHH
jgi:hypothetical protein